MQNYLNLPSGAGRADIPLTMRRKILVLGSNRDCTGSGAQADWCAVNAAAEARALGQDTILLTGHPETASSDDIGDRLVFDEITLDSILATCAVEQPDAVVVSMAGGTPKNLAVGLTRAGCRVLGTQPTSIDLTENRDKFSALLDRLMIPQPAWTRATPSPEHPAAIPAVETDAVEMELDAVARNGDVLLSAASERIERPGAHGGDGTLVYPARELSGESTRRISSIGRTLARALRIAGPFHVRLLVTPDDVRVIECQLKASRNIPFVSKALGVNFVREAMRAMLGAGPPAVLAADVYASVISSVGLQ